MRTFRYKTKKKPEHHRRPSTNRGVQRTSIYRPPKVETPPLRFFKEKGQTSRLVPSIKIKPYLPTVLRYYKPLRFNQQLQTIIARDQNQFGSIFDPKQPLVKQLHEHCVKRAARTTALFANGIAGIGKRFSPGQGGTYHRTLDSNKSC